MSGKEWTDELKAEVVAAYEAENPTPETTMEIVKRLADQFEKTVNGVRMVLTREGVYVKKTVTPASTTTSEGKPKRVNKAQAIDALKVAIKATGHDVDDDICDRLTGKAAVYITGLLR
jgi:predicted transcriptional regulator